MPSASVAGIQSETLDSMAAYWQQRNIALIWPSPFILPAWLAAWWPHFGGGHEWYLFSVTVQKQLVGLAPLMRKGPVARFIGDIEVCDHLDFVIAAQRADDFYPRVLDTLAQDGIQRLILEPIREGSSVISHLLPIAQKWGARVRCERQAQLLAMPLPTSWEAYLQRLRGKERHEIRRKLRRLNEAGRTSLRCVCETTAVPAAIQTFFDLFKSNNVDKAAFMNGPMASFFRQLATNLADAGLLKLFFLDLNDRPIAAAMCIDYQDTVYLYNSGYDADFRQLSAGLMSKVLSIQASIRDGRQVYDFLKGAEIYKKRLGGKPVDICRCVLDLDAGPADEPSADEKDRMVACRPIR